MAGALNLWHTQSREPLAKLLRQPLPALENSLKVVIESV